MQALELSKSRRDFSTKVEVREIPAPNVSINKIKLTKTKIKLNDPRRPKSN